MTPVLQGHLEAGAGAKLGAHVGNVVDVDPETVGTLREGQARQAGPQEDILEKQPNEKTKKWQPMLEHGDKDPQSSRATSTRDSRSIHVLPPQEHRVLPTCLGLPSDTPGNSSASLGRLSGPGRGALSTFPGTQ